MKRFAVYIEGISTPYFVNATTADAARAVIEAQGMRVLWSQLTNAHSIPRRFRHWDNVVMDSDDANSRKL